MMKKFFLFFLLLVSVSQPVATHTDAATINDEAGLFTADQIHSSEQQTEKPNEKIKGRVLIVTVTSNSEEPRDFADNYLREAVGNNQDDSVSLLDMEQREVYTSTSGNMIDYLTDGKTDSILDNVYDQMANAAYCDAAKVYLSKSTTHVKDGVPGGYYRVDGETGKITRCKVLTIVEIIITVVLALIPNLVFCSVAVPCYQLKSSIYKYPFQEESSIKLTKKTDHLANSFITTRRIPKSLPPGNGGGGSTTHPSGGGTSGGGGKSF